MKLAKRKVTKLGLCGRWGQELEAWWADISYLKNGGGHRDGGLATDASLSVLEAWEQLWGEGLELPVVIMYFYSVLGVALWYVECLQRLSFYLSGGKILSFIRVGKGSQFSSYFESLSTAPPFSVPPAPVF